MAGLEEADGALFAALRQQGLGSASSISSLADLEAEEVFEICAECVKSVNPNARVSQTLTPNPSDRFRACTELTNEIKALGFKFDLGFQQILYPTVKETRQLLVFLVDHFPKQKGGQAAADPAQGEEDGLRGKIARAIRSSLAGEDEPPHRSSFDASFWYRWQSPGPDDVSRLGGMEGQRVVDYLLERSSFERACGNAGRHELEDLPLNFDEGDLAEIGRAVAKAGGGEFEAKKPTAAVGRSRSTQSSIEFAVYGSARTAGPAGEVASGGGASGGDGANAAAASAEEGTPEAKKETIAEMRKRELRELHQDLVGLNRECEALKEGMQAKVESIREAEAEILRLHGEVRGLSGEHSVWKESVAIATAAAEGGDLDGAVKALEGEISGLEGDLRRMGSEWDELKAPVLQEIRRMRDVEAEKTRRRERVAKETAEMRQKIRQLQIDLRHRGQEKVQLQQDYKLADKTLNRYTYVERIGEIIKNVKKQEVEIERIVSDTLQVQRDINSAEESLHRAYTLADETIFREARSSKSVATKDLYRMVSEMHSSFAQVVENVRQIGKMERESQDCVRRTEELARTPFAQKIQKARADLGGLNQEIARMEAGA
ncbi:DUF812 domain-containing protein [Chloropicon roscoffensis]|uniref:DUF812 domain-containing protein n=1 Tax=Chloropicon roscoffensis TaxID=1461544 RepID=A0AAX4PKU1_9CHLO